MTTEHMEELNDQLLGVRRENLAALREQRNRSIWE